ncbi:MAG: secretin N-terminal domain-containing protein, partial [Planctomycetota bacterium]
EAIDLIDQVARDPSTRGSGDRWSVVHNEPAGTLIFTATRAEQSRVEGLLDQLAAIPPEHRIQTRSFTITNRDAVGLQASLFGLLGIDSPDVSSPDASDGSESGAARQTGAGSASRRDGLVLAVDDQLNTIIASGSPALLDRVAELIERLDIRQPQVLLEIILVSLSEGQSKDLGVEIQAQIGDSGTLFGLGSIFGLSNVGPGSGTPDAGGNGGSLVILDPGDFSVVVRALDTISDGRAVSTARTLVMNNESANISNTVSEPYADVVFDDGDAITGFGGSESAGTNISVTPQIAQGEFLVLDYDVSLSAFLGESTPGLPPSEQSTSISSTATIPDGHCVVVGGLELLNQSDTTTKTPMLAELPVLGGLFRNSSRSDSRTRFFLFIRASIMRERGFERLRHLSERRAADAEIDAGWPVVKPVLIR